MLAIFHKCPYTVRFIVHMALYNVFTTKKQGAFTMKNKYAVALLKNGIEKILAVFETKEEADDYGMNNRLPEEEGLQYCFATSFVGNTPCGSSINIYNTYNA